MKHYLRQFERELNGERGAFWKREAERDLQRIKEDLESGNLTIDENGVARNCCGRVLMDDMLAKVTFVTNKVNIEATQRARDEEVSESLRNYRANFKGYSSEELSEMRAAFGEGETIVNIITGEKITL